jgi:purine-binding chemotaxis protein CheW
VWLNTDVPTNVDRGAGSERELVVFTLHGERYGVPIETVREIVRYRRPTATAAAAGLIQGLISLRGEVLTVADLSSRLGRDAHRGEGAQIVVLTLAEGSLGLVVDHVEGVRRVPGDHVTRSPVPGTEQGFGEEIASIDDDLVLLLDPQRVLGGVLRRPAPKRTRAAKKPAGAANKPARAAKKPAGVAKKPAGAAKKPEGAAKKPAGTAKKPAATTRRATRRPPPS